MLPNFTIYQEFQAVQWFFFFSSEYSSFWSLVIYTRLFIFIFKICCRKQPQNMEPGSSSVSRLIKSSTVLYLKSGGLLSVSPDLEMVGCGTSESMWNRNQEKGNFSGVLGTFFYFYYFQGKSIWLVLLFSLSFTAFVCCFWFPNKSS